MVKGIVWLRNDLRISDHPALSRALQECDEVLFAYVFDDRGGSHRMEFPELPVSGPFYFGISGQSSGADS